MSNPNYEPEDVSVTTTAPVEEPAPRSYVAAGIVAALFIVLLCVLGIAVLSSGALGGRAAPTPASNTSMRLEAVNGIMPNAPFTLRGTGFVGNETVELFVAYTAGAPFTEFTKIGEAQSGADGSFEISGLTLPPNNTGSNTVYLLARGSSSGFSPVMPIIIGAGGPVPTATQPLATTATLPPDTPIPLTSTPPETPTWTPPAPTFTPSPPPPTGIPTPSSTPDPNAPGIWTGYFYDNPDLSDPPNFVRQDQNLNFNFRSGSPGGGLPNDNYSVRWTRNEDFRSTDNYIFTLTVDDGARVYVDGNLIINEWRNGGARTVTASHSITRGIHRITVEYYEATGNAQVSLSWAVGYRGWVGRYYNTPDLSGPLVLKRDDITSGDPFIDFDWGFSSPAPEINPDNFSVDWTRTVNFPIAGTYVFTATVDDGVRVFIDGNPTPVLDNFGSSGSRTIVGTVALSAGNHAMQVQYVERTGQSNFRLVWAPQVLIPTFTPTTPAPPPTTAVPPPTTAVPTTVTPGDPSLTPTSTDTPSPTTTVPPDEPTPTPTLTPTETPTTTPEAP